MPVHDWTKADAGKSDIESLVKKAVQLKERPLMRERRERRRLQFALAIAIRLIRPGDSETTSVLSSSSRGIMALIIPR